MLEIADATGKNSDDARSKKANITRLFAGRHHASPFLSDGNSNQDQLMPWHRIRFTTTKVSTFRMRFTAFVLSASWLIFAAANTEAQDTGWLSQRGVQANGVPMCVAGVFGYGDAASFLLKRWAGEPRLMLHVFNDGWSSSQGGWADVDIRVGPQVWRFEAFYYPAGPGGLPRPRIESFVGEGDIEVFLSLLARGRDISVTFDSGADPLVFGLNGSGRAVQAFRQCVQTLQAPGGSPVSRPR